MMPIGRQFASGLSLVPSSDRFCLSSAAQGRNGSPPGMFAPTLLNVDAGGSPGGDTGGGATLPPWNHALSPSPVRAGCPSAALGAGASRFGLPSAVRGTFFVGYVGHCADAGAANSSAAAV